MKYFLIESHLTNLLDTDGIDLLLREVLDI